MTGWRSEKIRRHREEVQPFVNLLKSEMPSDCEWHLLGSWRRGAQVIGDLDILVVTENGELSGDLFEGPGIELPPSVDWQRRGPKVAQGDLTVNGETIHIDVWSCKPNERGAYLCFATGPVELNLIQRQRAIRMGYALSQIGLLDRETKRQLDDGTERDIYRWIDMDYLEPEQRERFTKPKQPTPKSERKITKEKPMPNAAAARIKRDAAKPAVEQPADQPKIEVGGVEVTVAQAQEAVDHLKQSPGIMVRQQLNKLGNPLAGCDYHALARPEILADPKLKGHTKIAFIRAVEKVLSGAV